MHIAICDDEQKELLHLQTLVTKFDSCINISLFPSAESLLASITEQHCDIVLLDIEMDGLDGFTAAKKLKSIQNPPLIIFVTNSGEYTYRGYEVAFRYLPKPVSYAVLEEVLSAAVAKIAPQKLTINANGHTFVINVSDILYFEAFGHSLVAHTKGDSFECKMKLGEIAALLPPFTFDSPHRGYLVNLDFVDTVREKELLLSCGIQIPVSRRRRKEFEQALFRFVRRAL